MANPELVRKTKIEILQAVLTLDPTAPVFTELAEALLEDDQVESAIKSCQAGLRYHPDQLAGLVVLAEALDKAGRRQEALSALAVAQAKASQTNASLERLAALTQRLTQPTQARPAPLQSPAPRPALVDEETQAPVDLPSPTLAYLYLRQGDQASAIRVFERLLAKDPDNQALKAKLAALTKDMGASGQQRVLRILERWLTLAQTRSAKTLAD